MREPDLTVKQVAEELQAAPELVYTMCRRGVLASYRVGVRNSPNAPIRIRRKDLDEYKTKRSTTIQ
jgi:excisionase family DNA binding protein